MKLRSVVAGVLAAALVAGGCAPTSNQPAQTPPADSAGETADAPAPLVVVVDSSGSMATADAPGPRIDAARNALRTLLGGVGDNAELGLVVYGAHSREEDGPASCADITAPVPLAAVDRAAVTAVTDALTPGGWTPLGDSLTRSAEMLPADGSEQQIIVLSDGESTCEPPPCEVAHGLAERRPGLTISTIGFRSDVAELACVAEATGGLYVTARNSDQLSARLSALSRIGTATSTLSGRSAHGIEMGASLEAIRRSFIDFPATGEDRDGHEVMRWRYMQWWFADDLLVAVKPLGAGTTIDGVGAGTTVGRLIELYGRPLDWSTGPDGTTTGRFTADAGLGTVWVFTTTGRESSDTVLGMELRREEAGRHALMELVSPAGAARAYGTDWPLTATPPRYRAQQTFARSHGLVTTVHGDTNRGLRACWRETDASALCTSSIHDRLLFRVDADYSPAPGLDDGPGRSRREIVNALAVELDDGEVCDSVGYAGAERISLGTRMVESSFLCRDGRRLWRDMESSALAATLLVSRSSGGGPGTPAGDVAVAGYALPLDTDAIPR